MELKEIKVIKCNCEIDYAYDVLDDLEFYFSNKKIAKDGVLTHFGLDYFKECRVLKVYRLGKSVLEVLISKNFTKERFVISYDFGSKRLLLEKLEYDDVNNVSELQKICEAELKKCIDDLKSCDLDDSPEVMAVSFEMINFISKLNILSEDVLSAYMEEYMICSCDIGSKLLNRLCGVLNEK